MLETREGLVGFWFVCCLLDDVWLIERLEIRRRSVGWHTRSQCGVAVAGCCLGSHVI